MPTTLPLVFADTNVEMPVVCTRNALNVWSDVPLVRPVNAPFAAHTCS